MMKISVEDIKITHAFLTFGVTEAGQNCSLCASETRHSFLAVNTDSSLFSHPDTPRLMLQNSFDHPTLHCAI